MANFGKWKPKELTENESAAVKAIKLLGFAIILAVVIYSEFMFLSIIGVALPDGNNRAWAVTGAVATGASVVVLVGAKLWWVTPGGQFIWSWCFMLMELAVMALNDILGYALHFGPVGANLAWWQSATPASPLVAVVGWIFMLFLDATQSEKHKDMELQAKKQKKERQYIEAAHSAEMELRNDHLHMVTEQLRDAITSQAAQARIQQHAMRVVDRVLTDASGIVAGDYTPLSPAQKKIAPQAQTSLPQEATIEPVEEDEEENQPNWLQRTVRKFKRTPADDEDDAQVTCHDCGMTGAVDNNWHYYGNTSSGYYCCPSCSARIDAEDEADEGMPVYEQPVRKRPSETIEEVRAVLRDQLHTQAALQVKMEQMLKACGMTEDELEEEMGKFYDAVTKRRETKK